MSFLQGRLRATRICRETMNPRKDTTVYFTYQTKSGKHRKIRWCKKCDVLHSGKVNALFQKFFPNYKETA